jgi:anti-sigma B factor antagonist
MTAVPGPLQFGPSDRPRAAGAVPAPGSGGGLGVTTERRGRWWVLVLVGELDMATAPALDDHLFRALLLDCPPRIVVELSGVRFCDSSGAGALVRGWKRATALGGELVLLCPARRVADYLQMIGVDQGITVASAVPE